jgi:hypothetical protein
VDEYIRKLKSHDWFYHYTEDHRVWKAGQAVWDQLRVMQKQLDPSGEIWNEHCPPEFKLHLKQKRLDEIEAQQKPELTVEEMYPGCNKKMLDVLRKVVEDDRR